MVGGILFTENC